MPFGSCCCSAFKSDAASGRACRLPCCDRPPEPAGPAALGMPRTICSSSPPTHRLPRQLLPPARAAQSRSWKISSFPSLRVAPEECRGPAAVKPALGNPQSWEKGCTGNAQAQQSHQSWRLALQRCSTSPSGHHQALDSPGQASSSPAPGEQGCRDSCKA